MHEMWEEFKFAVNWRAGDTKPIKTGSQSRVGSRSLLSKSNAESINKYGVILDDDKSRKDSTYATFNENVYGEKKWRNHVENIISISIVFLGILFCQTFVTFCCNKPVEEENAIIYKPTGMPLLRLLYLMLPSKWKEHLSYKNVRNWQLPSPGS